MCALEIAAQTKNLNLAGAKARAAVLKMGQLEIQRSEATEVPASRIQTGLGILH